jgi:hypothetical protein
MVEKVYRQHPAAVATTYGRVERHALSQGVSLIGTPGAITVRANAAGARFHVRQYYDHDGRKRDHYLAGAPGDPAVDASIKEWRLRVEEAKDILRDVRLLSREGYATLAPKQFAAIATLGNHGIFKAGAVLVGAHAFEVIANRLGIHAAASAIEDAELARPAELALERAPRGPMLELLRKSGLDFVDVPGTGHADAPAYLRYLTAQTQDGAVMSKHGVAAVRVPLAERFALHKLVVAQLRTARSQKGMRDQQQAAILIAALGDLHPGTLVAAYAGTPTAVRKHIRMGLRQIRETLAKQPRGWEEIADVAKP